MIMITHDDFSIDEVVNEVKSPDMGAIVTFLGTVRDESGGQVVERMEIQACEDVALRQLKRIEGEALKKFDVKKMTIIHRVGVLNVSDNILLIVVGASHRDDAFRACRFVLEELKRAVPLWKKEYTPSGDRWVLGESYGQRQTRR